jgi:phosphomannomutase
MQSDAELVNAYVDRIARHCAGLCATPCAGLHTTAWSGWVACRRVVEACRFSPVMLLPEQVSRIRGSQRLCLPNGEPVIDLALALAQDIGADLVIANDPDADRLAAAVVVDGHWRMLSGDELGVLLGEDALRRGARGTYACSIVSSSLLAAIASAYRQPFVYTLTGFKWIGRVPGLVYGYEEAIGYCTDPQAVPDKDGISALARLLRLAASLKADGRSIADRLDEIACHYGVYETDQMSLRVKHVEIIAEAMARLRASPPTMLAGEPTSIVDLAQGSDELPPTDAVLINGETVKVVARPSGTEPKLKCYLEARRPAPSSSADLAAARAGARSTLARIRSEMAEALGIGAYGGC